MEKGINYFIRIFKVLAMVITKKLKKDDFTT